MRKRITLIMLGSFLAIAVLILFQLKWMQQSRHLMEETFHQKVMMALCSAIEGMAEEGCGGALRQSCASNPESLYCQDHLMALSQDPRFEQELRSSLSFYDIDMDYEFQIVKNAQLPTAVQGGYSCSLNPLMNANTHSLQVQFPGKERYILRRMGIMIFVFLLILSFIGCVFVLANYYLLRQERVRALNVEFFNHMAHEFRTPLANIQLAARLLQKQAHIPRENRFWEIIHSESAQLQQQLESVLELAGMEESEYRLQCEPIQLEELLHKVVEEMKLQAQERNGEIRLHTPAYAVNCHADKYHLHHAFRNLIDNALKYGGPNPRLHISLHDDAAGVIIRFKDNGPGIAPRQRALILRPFRRLSPEDKKGFGLGLPYVKKVVELHRGRLQIISRENDGSTFEICLPRKKTA